MISKLYAAWLACIAIYEKQDAFDKIINVGCDVIGIKEVNNTLTITPLGTIDKAMWESNCQIETIDHLIFGPMHAGFLSSAEAIYAALKPLLIGKVSFQGHSRGASLCNILASLCAIDGIKVAQLFLFECPNVGEQKYSDFCAGQVIDGLIGFDLSTTNGADPVPFVPPLPMVKSYPTTDLDHAPGGLEDIDLIDWHAGATIYAGMQSKFPL